VTLQPVMLTQYQYVTHVQSFWSRSA